MSTRGSWHASFQEWWGTSLDGLLSAWQGKIRGSASRIMSAHASGSVTLRSRSGTGRITGSSAGMPDTAAAHAFHTACRPSPSGAGRYAVCGRPSSLPMRVLVRTRPMFFQLTRMPGSGITTPVSSTLRMAATSMSDRLSKSMNATDRHCRSPIVSHVIAPISMNGQNPCLRRNGR
ncbi:hypothetical protein BLIC_b01363 [Bifidobacterium longum subsp. infantis]|nr:hypothetical protein BLIC_a01350 [Bifidobacterium longum subsp. infantis]CEF00652.1 hypothetical protein BLIC_b01363 [Bifidobacterium longum subsp. infantis]CEF06393.1 hypothetical protein BLIC_e01374 [Bifidobacterium longum subsp. infantis]